MAKQIMVNYKPNESKNLCSDNLIADQVDLMLGLFESSDQSLDFSVSQWVFVNEFLFRFMNGELSREELVFIHNGEKIEYDDLGYFINEPGSFKPPSQLVVEKINRIRLSKL